MVKRRAMAAIWLGRSAWCAGGNKYFGKVTEESWLYDLWNVNVNEVLSSYIGEIVENFVDEFYDWNRWSVNIYV